MNLKHIRLIAATVATAVVIPFAASAADLTVAQGDSPMTISADTTYDAVVVNGDLTVAPNVTLTCTSLTVADNNNGTATLTIGDGAVVSVTGSNKTKIGVGNGRAEVYLGTGSRLSASGDLNFCYGYDSVPASGLRMTEALLVVGTNSTVYAGDEFFVGWASNGTSYIPSGTSRSDIKAEIRLDKGAQLTTQRIRIRSNISEKVIFNGGQIVQRSSTYSNAFVYFDWDSKETNLFLEGTNGCPVNLYVTDRGSLQALFRVGSSSTKIFVSGDGGFAKFGPGIIPLALIENWDSGTSNLRFVSTGDFVVSQGGLSVANTVATSQIFAPAKSNVSRPVDLVVKNGASFDFAGNDVVMNSITALGSGIITNSAEGTVSATIGVRNDGRASTLARAFPGIAFVKQGATPFTLCGPDIDSFNIKGGTLALKSRSVMGYPFYRVKFDKTGMDEDSSINNTMRVREFAFFAGGQNVTRPYVKAYYDKSGTSWITEPTLIFDGNFDTVYEDYRMHKAIGDSDRDKVQISLEYESCQGIDSYRWAPYYSTEFQYRLAPTAWRVFGGFSSSPDVLLDQVTGFSVPGTENGWMTTNFVCNYAPTTSTIGALTLASGSALDIDGADVTVSSATAAAGVPVKLAHGAALTLPAEAAVTNLTINLGHERSTMDVLNPVANGNLYVTGTEQELRGDLLNVGTCVNESNLRKWKVWLNGTDMHRTLCVEDGALRLTPLSTMIYMR